MRVEFREHDSFVEAERAAKIAVESYFVGQNSNKHFWGAIDGVPISKYAGFPKLDNSNECYTLMDSFILMKLNLMSSALEFSLEYSPNGEHKVFAGSFFIRVALVGELFLEVNFREELDQTCVDPIMILGLRKTEDFSFARILMVGQRKLTIEEDQIKNSVCKGIVISLARALTKRQNFYKWKNIFDNLDIRDELAIRASKFELSMAQQKLHIEHGILGPRLKQLAEQYLT